MTVLKLEEASRARASSGGELSTRVEPIEGVELVAPTAEQAWVQAVRSELDGYCITLRQLCRMQPDEVMLTLSGFTARLSEIRIHLVRNDSRRFTSLRTKEVDPLLEECDRQFRIHSRIQAIRAFDFEVSGRGQM